MLAVQINAPWDSNQAGTTVQVKYSQLTRMNEWLSEPTQGWQEAGRWRGGAQTSAGKDFHKEGTEGKKDIKMVGVV